MLPFVMSYVCPSQAAACVRTFGFFVTAQPRKQIWFNFSKAFSRLVGWTFLIIREKIEFSLSFCKSLEKFIFSLIQEYHFNDRSASFHHFWLRYYILICWSTSINIRAHSEYMFQIPENKRWTSLIHAWFFLNQCWFFQFLKSQTQIKSELIIFETELMSAGILRVL